MNQLTEAANLQSLQFAARKKNTFRQLSPGGIPLPPVNGVDAPERMLYLRPWLGHFLAALRYDAYFRSVDDVVIAQYGQHGGRSIPLPRLTSLLYL